MIKKVLCLVTLAALALGTNASDADFFTPVKTNALRLPSVPLAVVDPYFSIWTQYDHLYDGSTEHWSGHTSKPLTGVLRVDGKAYRFMGVCNETVLPTAVEGNWSGQYTNTTPSAKWIDVDFDDSSWKTGQAAFGGGDNSYKNINTDWNGSSGDIWVRRTFELSNVDPNSAYSVIYKHDDTFELYLNGTRIANTGYSWNVSGAKVDITPDMLRTGKNVLAAHCHNTTGGAYVDFGLYRNVMQEAVQTRCVVMPTSTYYSFRCGDVNLDLVFTTPFVMKDLDLFCTPIVYISYQVKANDGKEHDVEVYIETSSELAVRNTTQKAVALRQATGPLTYLRVGNQEQNPLSHSSDIVDWGYFYLAKENVDKKTLGLKLHKDILDEFLQNGNVTPAVGQRTSVNGIYYSMVYVDSLGTVGSEGARDFTMLGYDDTYSIQYHGQNRRGYWTQNGKVTIRQRFENLQANYDSIMTLCREQDLQIYNDAFEYGGAKYAEICCAVYRQANAAHKLVTDTKGNLMYMSKENTSGGFINTLDVTYPSEPLYLIYNCDLAKAMLTPVFEYTALGKWHGKWANHDLGNYPRANGQTYGGSMPVEECGNALTLMAAIARIDNDLDYVERYWSIMTGWADYLVENGKDPENQLCTDDFMGKSERNANLAVKAIMGVASYSELANMLGKTETATEYMEKAQEMTTYWSRNALSTTGGTHYLLNFGADGATWSNKYNMVWDKLWGWNLFKSVRTRELAFYQNKMTTYGLPLDNRQSHCKNDWHMWTASLTDTKTALARYVNPMWKFINECPTRVPVTDCHFCSNASRSLFHARSVVGGYWMVVFMNKFLAGELTPTPIMPTMAPAINTLPQYFDLEGRKLSTPPASGIYLMRDTNGRTRKIAN